MENNSVKSIGQRLAAVRTELGGKANTDISSSAGELISDIEMRWGPGFAEWIVSGLKKET